jgi:hypothetical protein
MALNHRIQGCRRSRKQSRMEPDNSGPDYCELDLPLRVFDIGASERNYGQWPRRTRTELE